MAGSGLKTVPLEDTGSSNLVDALPSSGLPTVSLFDSVGENLEGYTNEASVYQNSSYPIGFKDMNPNSFQAGFGRGSDQLQAQAFAGLEALSNAIEDNTLRRWAAQGKVKNLQEAQEYGTPIQFSDLDSFGDYLSYGISKSGELLPTVAAYGGAALAGGVVGGPAGSVAGIAAVGAPQNVGTMQIQAEQLRGPGATLTGGEVAAAAGLTALDMVGVNILTKPVTKAAIQSQVKEFGSEATQATLEASLLKGGVSASVAKSAAEGAVVGAGMASISVGVTEATGQIASGMEVDWDTMLTNMQEAALLGTAIGGPLGSVGGYVKHQNTKNFISGEVSPINEVIKPRNLVQRGYDVLAGSMVAPLGPVLTKTTTGRKLYDLFKQDMEIDRRDKHAGYSRSLANIQETARAEYGRKWQDGLINDYRNNTGGKAANDLRKHLDGVATDAELRGMLKFEDRIENYLPSLVDSDRILKNWDEFKADLVAKGYDVEANAGNLARYKKAMETGNWSKMSESFAKIDEAQLSDLNYGQAKAAFEANAARIRELKAQRKGMTRAEKKAAGPTGKIGRKPKKELNTLTKRQKQLRRVLEGKAGARGRLGNKSVGSQLGNIEGHRMFDVDQSFYDKWSVGGNEGRFGWEAIQDYSSKAAHRFAGVDHLGKNGEKLNQLIMQTDAALSKEHGEKLTQYEIKRMYDMVDAFDNTYSRIQDSTYRKIATMAKLGTTVATLPLVVLSSITEIFNVAIKTDITTAVKATLNVAGDAAVAITRGMAMRPQTDRHKTQATQMQIAGQSLEQVQDANLARLTDPNMSRLSANLTKGFFKMNGLTYWTQAMRQISAEAARITIKQDVDTLNSMPNTAEAQRAGLRLQELGMSADDVASLKPNSGIPREVINRIYGRAIDRFNRTVVLEPSFADRPLWMSNQHMWMLSQLMGYPTMFTNTVLPMLGKKLLTKAPASVVDGLFIVGGVTLIGAMQMSVKDAISGRDMKAGEEYASQSLVRNLAPMPAQMMYNAWTAAKYGKSPVDSASGPFLGITSNAVAMTNQLSTGAISMEEYLQKMAIELTPARAIKSHWQ